jgi:hypothetical protein
MTGEGGDTEQNDTATGKGRGETGEELRFAGELTGVVEEEREEGEARKTGAVGGEVWVGRDKE